MKKWLLQVLIVLLAAVTGYAQFTDQGNFLVGTTIGLSSASSRVIQNEGTDQNEGAGPSSLQFSFAPKVGYFVIDNLAVGIGMDYTLSRVDQPNEDVTTDSDLLFGPFGRYFVPFGSGDVALFVEANVGFGSSSDNQELLGVAQNIQTNIFSIGIGPGITVISDSGLGVSATLKYNYARSRFDTNINNVQRETITRSNVFDFSIGFQYYFGGLTVVPTDTRVRGF